METGAQPSMNMISWARATKKTSFKEGRKIVNDDEWNLRKIIDLQQQHRRDYPVQKLLIKIEPLPPRIAIGTKIQARADYYAGLLRGLSVREQIQWKVARAVEEHRIPEAQIAAIFPRLENALNRGAYFVACAKGVFAQNGLSWFEEDWNDA